MACSPSCRPRPTAAATGGSAQCSNPMRQAAGRVSFVPRLCPACAVMDAGWLPRSLPRPPARSCVLLLPCFRSARFQHPACLPCRSPRAPAGAAAAIAGGPAVALLQGRRGARAGPAATGGRVGGCMAYERQLKLCRCAQRCCISAAPLKVSQAAVLSEEMGRTWQGHFPLPSCLIPLSSFFFLSTLQHHHLTRLQLSAIERHFYNRQHQARQARLPAKSQPC